MSSAARSMWPGSSPTASALSCRRCGCRKASSTRRPPRARSRPGSSPSWTAASSRIAPPCAESRGTHAALRFRLCLPAMRIDFTKMHGVGNDFVVFDAPADESILMPERLRTLADRRTGIGFDQALVLGGPKRADSGVFYRIFNADGDEVEQCGNGARCIAALLHHRGAAGNGALTLDSPAGVVQARIDGASVSVDMGVPNFAPRSLPFEAQSEAA